MCAGGNVEGGGGGEVDVGEGEVVVCGPIEGAAQVREGAVQVGILEGGVEVDALGELFGGQPLMGLGGGQAGALAEGREPFGKGVDAVLGLTCEDEKAAICGGVVCDPGHGGAFLDGIRSGSRPPGRH